MQQCPLGLLLDGFRADRAHPLPQPPVSPRQVHRPWSPWAAAPPATPTNSGGSGGAWRPTLVVGRLRQECLGDPRYWTSQPEKGRFICRILVRKLISIVCQLVLLAATRCSLIQMLGWALACANGCSF
jgi:hypothetical protein